MGKKLNFIILFVLVLLSLSAAEGYTELSSSIDAGDTAWMLVSSAFVLLMTPGLSFFYGGMVNKKNIISTMLQSFIALGVISVLWVIVGFSLAFGESFGGIIGNPMTYFAFHNVGTEANPNFAGTIPFLLFALFQLKFAIITPALITGSFAGRVRFRSYILFMVLFSIFIYSPLAHMTWHPDGLLRKWGVLDFAGGTVVHMSAGLLLWLVLYFSVSEERHSMNLLTFRMSSSVRACCGSVGLDSMRGLHLVPVQMRSSLLRTLILRQQQP